MSSAEVAVTPSRIFNSPASAVTFVPPISRVVTDISPATVAIPDANVIRSSSSVKPSWPPLINISPAIVVVEFAGVELPVTVT